jgi:hypothetical protein
LSASGDVSEPCGFAVRHWLGDATHLPTVWATNGPRKEGVVVRFVRTYGALVFTVFLVFVLSGALIRWVTGSVWASNIGGLVAALGYLWVGRMLWRRRVAEDASEAALEAYYRTARQRTDDDAVEREQNEDGSR